MKRFIKQLFCNHDWQFVYACSDTSHFNMRHIMVKRCYNCSKCRLEKK